ncbi:TonB-dependent receptor [Paraburkholderia sp. DD10]|uniref:Outer membrane receptor proteins, mostly Fe transport n=1 Tax=Paraburkholderia terricola TaxID=169427 RepID=A0A1M6KDZ7_9BURK|nr:MULTISPECIES: TonB-dependent receptor [Paraburkholderia]SDN69894.1 Outer membrane receptor proteins, mostly Fe transport [Paraburkholderia sediminicola]SHJ57057.1 Outer membrane receptor proteins, mostly Fe transport [Paraburkholderia terricola]
MNMPFHSRRTVRLRRRIGLTLGFGGALAGLSVTAWAQAEPAVAASAAAAKPDQASADVTLAPVVVVGTTPLLGIGTPLSQVPANVQTVRAQELDQQHRSTLTDYFAKNLPSVDIADAQGNPYQVNINYRGFTASPLLGTPQGLSVFVDGVRVNEPFGDVVNWDLIPQQAIDTIQLIPGSNPTYGFNTLGGAISISTKNGKTSPGGEAEVALGSWGRKTAQIEQGGTLGANLDYYVTGSVANDNGWAEQNASRVRQAFGKLRYTDADTTLSFSAGGADNDLHGAQTIPRSFLGNPKQPYTYPDQNVNEVGYVTLSGDHYFNDHVELSGNLYYRHFRNSNLSSNVNSGFGSVDDDGNIDTVQATNDKSSVTTESYGASLQLTLLGKLGGMENQFVAGVSADLANSRYVAASQEAAFTDSRATLGLGDFTQETAAKTHNGNYGIYLQDTLSLTRQWSLTLAGRYNWADATIGDSSGTQPQLNGHHTFSRFNPAVGINWNPSSAFTAYATYNEGMRSPTAIELACADPAAPCSLPNDFVSDPSLEPVISRTFEIGARGRVGQATTWSAAVYSTTLDNDIQFISSNGASSTEGFFQNVGRTRRQGAELSGHSKFGPLAVTASYSYVDATYRSTWTEHSPSNSSADANGNITVKSGNHIPGIPANTIKLQLDYAATSKWNVGANLTWRGGIYAQGDENNQDVNGKIAGYLLIDLDTSYQVTKQLQVFASITNLLDKRYASFGTLGENFFNGPNHTFDGASAVNEQFVGPGAPRGVWMGLRYAWK